MKRLTIYVATTLLYTSFIIIVALSAIFVIFTYISQAKNIGQGGYSAFSAFLYVAYETPYNIYLIMPICGLLGGMMGLSLLSSNSEIIVMRASGLSIMQISKGVLLTGFFLGIITFFIGAYISPIMQKKADILKTISTKNSKSLFLYGSKVLWSKSNNTIVKISHGNPNKPLSDITKYKIEDNKLTSIDHADTAVYKNDQWHMKNVNLIKINSDSAQNVYKKNDVWSQIMPPKIMKIISSESRYLDINQIIKYIRLNNSDSFEEEKIKLRFWQIVFQPIALIILMMISVPFSLGSSRATNAGLKFSLGVILGFSYYIVNQAFGPLTLVYNLPPFLGAALPSFLYFCVLVLLFIKMKE